MIGKRSCKWVFTPKRGVIDFIQITSTKWMTEKEAIMALKKLMRMWK